MTTLIIKMITGEEVIAETEASPQGYLELTNAMSLIGRPDETGNVRMAMVPYAQFATSKKVRVYPHAIMADYEPALEILNQYNRLFGTGIQIATADMMPK
jgi:hypothetical protein